MALVITPGAPDAEAYIDVQGTDEYFSKFFPSKLAEWQSFQTEEQEASLRSSTKMLDYMVDWKGHPTDITTPQALQHPRIGLTDRMGNVFPDDEILPDVKAANAELALYLLKNGGAGSNESVLKAYSSLKIGSNFSVNINSDKEAQPIPSYIMTLILPWGSRGDGSAGTARLERC